MATPRPTLKSFRWWRASHTRGFTVQTVLVHYPTRTLITHKRAGYVGSIYWPSAWAAALGHVRLVSAINGNGSFAGRLLFMAITRQSEKE